MYSNYFFVRNTRFLARQYNWSNMFNTIITCRLSHYFRLKTCSSFLSQSHVFHLMFVINYVTVLSGMYPANFTRIPDSTGCLHFTEYRIVLSGSGTSLGGSSCPPSPCQYTYGQYEQNLSLQLKKRNATCTETQTLKVPTPC